MTSLYKVPEQAKPMHRTGVRLWSRRGAAGAPRMPRTICALIWEVVSPCSCAEVISLCVPFSRDAIFIKVMLPQFASQICFFPTEHTLGPAGRSELGGSRRGSAARAVTASLPIRSRVNLNLGFVVPHLEHGPDRPLCRLWQMSHKEKDKKGAALCPGGTSVHLPWRLPVAQRQYLCPVRGSGKGQAPV